MVLLDTLRNHPLTARFGKFVPELAWERRPSLPFSLCAATLVASLVLGGGTRGGFLSDAVLELLAIPAFLLSLSSLVAQPWTKGQRAVEWALLLCLAIAVLPLVQLVPLPPSLWRLLPRRDALMPVFDLIGREPSWLPISVMPSATWLSALSLLPPIAVFLSVLQLGYRERRQLSLLFLAFGVIAAMIGLLQVAQGPSSPLRFFSFTNPREAVGFFANRNHFAALLYVLLVYAAAWATHAAFSAGSLRDLRNLETSSIAALTASLLVLIVVIAAETITRSRAGLGLMILGMFAVFALPLTDRRRGAGVTPIRLIIGALVIALLLSVQFALYRILDRFATDPLEDARTIFAHNTIAAALAYMPFGSGFGTFVPVYETFEHVHDVIANLYVNHAHDDVLEAWLEGGAVALGLMAAFAVWFVLRALAIWRRPPSGIRPIDLLLMRASTIVIVLIVAHSLVDYPLRTDAMMAVLALSCAFLLEPLSGAETASRDAVMAPALPHYDDPPRRSLPPAPSPIPARRETAPSAGEATTAPVPLRRATGRWGEGVEWPEEWTKSKGGDGKRGPDDKKSEP